MRINHRHSAKLSLRCAFVAERGRENGANEVQAMLTSVYLLRTICDATEIIRVISLDVDELLSFVVLSEMSTAREESRRRRTRVRPDADEVQCTLIVAIVNDVRDSMRKRSDDVTDEQGQDNKQRQDQRHEHEQWLAAIELLGRDFCKKDEVGRRERSMRTKDTPISRQRGQLTVDEKKNEGNRAVCRTNGFHATFEQGESMMSMPLDNDGLEGDLCRLIDCSFVRGG